MRAWAATLVLLVFAVPAASAQDFTSVVSPALAHGAATLLDLGLPPRSAAAELASSASRPYGLAELDAGWIAAGGGVRAVRSALGVARSGDRTLGWQSLGVAIGLARDDAGVAVRGVARRDRAHDTGVAQGSPESVERSIAAADGAEIGAGGWVRIAHSTEAWVAHPQLATRGAAPPLRRALEAGISWQNGAVGVWVVREAAPGTRTSESHRLGLGLGVPRAWVWGELRDAPLRCAVGVAARAGGVAVAAVADMHPVLPPTARLSLSFGGAAW